MGYEIGTEKVTEKAEAFGINKTFDFDLPISKSQIQYKKMNDTDAALISIGQGQLLMTPLQVAMMGSAIANGGKIMKPYLVESITSASGLTLGTTKPSVLYLSLIHI